MTIGGPQAKARKAGQSLEDGREWPRQARFWAKLDASRAFCPWRRRSPRSGPGPAEPSREDLRSPAAENSAAGPGALPNLSSARANPKTVWATLGALAPFHHPSWPAINRTYRQMPPQTSMHHHTSRPRMHPSSKPTSLNAPKELGDEISLQDTCSDAFADRTQALKRATPRCGGPNSRACTRPMCAPRMLPRSSPHARVPGRRWGRHRQRRGGKDPDEDGAPQRKMRSEQAAAHGGRSQGCNGV